MSNANIPVTELKNLFLQDTPFIDVRAPVEFAQGSLPGAVNLPILNDEERALIGTTYKQSGQDAAVRLGYQLISGAVKEERVQRWQSFISAHPQTVLYCFRGGKRSQITQQWLKDIGVERPLIVGGYKATRQFLMNEIEAFAKKKSLLVVSGPTGSGKTDLLKEAAAFYPSIDLEGLAHHRGSAFGSLDSAQPSQIDFENRLAVTLIKVEDKNDLQLRPIVEDESRLIGRVTQPMIFFERLRTSEVLWIDEPLEVRVENIFKDYIENTDLGMAHSQTARCAEELQILRSQALRVFEKYKKSLMSIHRKLGGLRTQEIMADLETSEHNFLNSNEVLSNKVWIEKLLNYYYDPLYLGSLERRQVSVCFKGTKKQALEYLQEAVSR
ncbi:tRNA 2-selenouridine(34) synthase MnmH [Bdellovibrio sp.]|uniref:tRNA 2-selenouridine(34) synthase MnmH n=1 Tax=Bdellovibrio sp. TaxID=28201 RepID=UPI0039E4CA20